MAASSYCRHSKYIVQGASVQKIGGLGLLKAAKKQYGRVNRAAERRLFFFAVVRQLLIQ